MGEAGEGGRQRLAERGGHPAGQGAGGAHRDLLAEHRAHRRLETVERAGHAQARMRLGEFAEPGAHLLRLTAEIEQPLQAPQHLRHRSCQRRGQGHRQQRPARYRPHRQPAAQHLTLARQRHGASVDAVVHRFDAGDGALAEKRQQAGPVQRRTVGELKIQAVLVTAGRQAPQLRGLQPVALAEQRIKAAHAAEPGGQRHFGDRQAGVGEQPLGQQQALGLGVGHRRDAELVTEGAPQVAVADAQLRGQGAEVVVGEAAFVDARRHRPRQPAAGVDAGVAGRQLGAAAQAGAIAAGFGGGGAGEKAAIVPPRYASRAHRPAVHPGGHHGDEELPVETGVAGGQRLITDIVIDPHGVIIDGAEAPDSPFSDPTVGACLWERACPRKAGFAGRQDARDAYCAAVRQGSGILPGASLPFACKQAPTIPGRSVRREPPHSLSRRRAPPRGRAP